MKRTKVTFESPALMVHASAVDPRWFDAIDCVDREEFALKYATKTWSVHPNGNPMSIVVSYPRPDGSVKMYDLDSGTFCWVKLERLTEDRVSGKNVSRNYEFSAVMQDDTACESEDINLLIDWRYFE